MRNFFIILLSIFSFGFASAQNATLTMTDAFGDGWNSGDVTIEGVSYTFTTGTSSVENITLADINCVTAVTTAGNYGYEMGFTLVNNATGVTILNMPAQSYPGNANNADALTFESLGCSATGCMTVGALNYNVNATTDDGTCLFDQTWVDGNSGSDCTEFEDSIVVLNTLLVAADAQNLALSNDLNTALGQLLVLQDDYNALLVDYNTLVIDNAALQGTYDILLLDYNLLYTDFGALTTENFNLVIDNDALFSENVTLNTVIDGLNNTVSVLQNTNNQLVFDLVDCQTEYDVLNNDYNFLDGEHVTLTNNFNVVSGDLIVSNDSIIVLNALLADCLDNDQVDCSGFEAQISLLEGQLVACAGGIETLNTEIFGLGLLLDDCTNDNEALLLLNDALVDENVLLNADLADCNFIYDELNTLYVVASTELADCNENYGITTQLNVDLTNTNVVLNDSIVQLNVELTDCLENGADCSSQDMIIAELQGTIGAYQAEIDILTDTILALQLQITELQAVNAANVTTIDNLTYDVNFYLSTIEANEILIADLQQQLADCLEGDMTGIIDNGSTDTEKVLLFATNALGQRVAADTVGQIIILHYADGSSEKIIRDIR